MSVLNARSRLVNFRLTPAEMENLRVACLLHGARNMSDFARSAVLQSVEVQVHPESQLAERFTHVEVRLSELDASVRHFTEMLRGLLKTLVQDHPAGTPGRPCS